jgi:SWI/SNF-related matrix-associated actin-dependent regulator of chromatin subfamily A3
MHRIPYVRFDGQMSAKRRKETLERFSVPIEEPAEVVSQTQSQAEDDGRRLRRRSFTKVTDRGVEAIADGDDSDFAMSTSGTSNDFLSNDELKKAKGKAKRKTNASVPKQGFRPSINDLPMDGTNPKVMLISLKAGALGLNLTVANNVYL